MIGVLCQVMLIPEVAPATLLSGSAATSLVELSHEQRTYLFRTLIASEFPAGTAPCEADEHCESKHR